MKMKAFFLFLSFQFPSSQLQFPAIARDIRRRKTQKGAAEERGLILSTYLFVKKRESFSVRYLKDLQSISRRFKRSFDKCVLIVAKILFAFKIIDEICLLNDNDVSISTPRSGCSVTFSIDDKIILQTNQTTHLNSV